MITPDLVLQIIHPIAIGGLFLYIRSIKQDLKDVNHRLEDLSNGCFARHAKIERELGQRETELKFVNSRLNGRT
jgi:hypothetical protein